MNWNDVKFKDYLAINEINEREDTEYNKLLDITAVVNNVDVEDITISNFKQYAENIKFITEDIPVVEIKDEYGKYKLHKELSQMSMQQYMDFTNYAKANDYAGVLSVFLIPIGKEYNKEYNIDDVREYIYSMRCTDVLSIYSFFLLQSTMYIECFRIYLKQQQQKILTKRKMERRKQMKLTEIYQLYRRYVACLIYHTYRYLRCRLSRFSIYLTGLLSKMKRNSKS